MVLYCSSMGFFSNDLRSPHFGIIVCSLMFQWQSHSNALSCGISHFLAQPKLLPHATISAIFPRNSFIFRMHSRSKQQT